MVCYGFMLHVSPPLVFSVMELNVLGHAQAVDYIHANEVILTFGYSHTTLLFLTEAAKKRNFQVGLCTVLRTIAWSLKPGIAARLIKF